jgi:RNA polymerase sigma-70 factor (ECF subfamily)
MRAGDDSALNLLMTRHTRRLYSVAQRLLGLSATAEDIEEVLSDSFLRAWETCASYDPSRGSVSTWLGWIVVYQSLSRRKRLAHDRRIETAATQQAYEDKQDTTAEDVDDRLYQSERVKLAIILLGRQHPTDADLLIRRFFDHKSIASIAQALGISEGATRVRLHRALQRIRKILQEKD